MKTALETIVGITLVLFILASGFWIILTRESRRWRKYLNEFYRKCPK